MPGQKEDDYYPRTHGDKLEDIGYDPNQFIISKDGVRQIRFSNTERGTVQPEDNEESPAHFVNAEKSVRTFLGLELADFLANTQNIHKNFLDLLKDHSLESAIGASNIYRAAAAITEDESITLSDQSKDILNKIILTYREHLNSSAKESAERQAQRARMEYGI